MNKILIISEGSRPDIKIIEYLLNLNKELEINYHIETYDTNIHMLYQSIKDEYSDEMDDIQLIPILREKKENFNFQKDDFSEIYLIFDYDLHHYEHVLHLNKTILNEQLKKMLNYFSNETEMGKLYINYPMVESFFHMNFEIENYLKNLTVINLIGSSYKSTLEITRNNTQFIQGTTRGNYDYSKIKKITTENIKKENYIVKEEYIVPCYDIYKNITLLNIFENQIEKYVENGETSVLSSFPKFIIDYFGERVFIKLTSLGE